MTPPRPIDDLAHRFQYHPADTEERQGQHQAVREQCHSLAWHFDQLLPDGREKSVAITKVEEAMFWANASLARQPTAKPT